jgi:hypothetical protein
MMVLERGLKALTKTVDLPAHHHSNWQAVITKVETHPFRQSLIKSMGLPLSQWVGLAVVFGSCSFSCPMFVSA